MRRSLLATAVVILPMAATMLPAGPSAAATQVICVGAPPGALCDQTVGTVPAAITAADANSVDDTILLAPGTYSDGPYVLDGLTHAITLQGSGEDNTFITLAPSASADHYVYAQQASVRNLTITMAGASSTGDSGLYLASHSDADHVTVVATAVSNGSAVVAGLSTLGHVTVQAPPDGASSVRGIYSSGGNIVTDSAAAGSPAFELSDPGAVDHLSRVGLRSDTGGVLTDGGSVVIDDAVIDLGVGVAAVGLAAVNFNNSTADKTITADHVTIVGGGAGSRGAWAYAAAQGAVQKATVTLTNSIVRGPETSVAADASNDGAQSGPSTATVDLSHTDYQTTGGTVDTAGGTGAGGVVLGSGNLVDVDPAFVGPSDLHLTGGSPVVDRGDPAAGGPLTDLDGNPRVADGDLVLGAIRDMGAYELQDTTAPETTITDGPAGLTGDDTPTFAFTSEPGATFACRVDAAAYAVCTSPFTPAALADGAHTVEVRATDPALNTDATPAARSFTVDTTAPETTATKRPPKRTTRTKVKLAFTSETGGATFECSVDGRAYRPCTSPLRLEVKVGKHTVLVRAVDAAGNADPTPARYKFKRLHRPRHQRR